MGEASAGRSATRPTFFKSTSVRTRIEWQNSQVVWTALDQRNFTGAPQLGQFAVGVLILDRAGQPLARRRTRRRTLSSGGPRSLLRGGDGNRRYSNRAIHIQGTCGRRDAIR